MSNWQFKVLIFSRGGAETDGGEGLKMQEMSVGEEQNRPYAERRYLSIHTYTLSFQIQFYNLKVILGGNSCIVNFQKLNLNI